MGANCNMSKKGLAFSGWQAKAPAAAKCCNIQQEYHFLTLTVLNSVAALTEGLRKAKNGKTMLKLFQMYTICE